MSCKQKGSARGDGFPKSPADLGRWIDGERGVSNGRRRRGGGVVWRASLVRQAGDRPFGRVAANARRELSTH
jgi:hypothetical protein